MHRSIPDAGYNFRRKKTAISGAERQPVISRNGQTATHFYLSLFLLSLYFVFVLFYRSEGAHEWIFRSGHVSLVSAEYCGKHVCGTVLFRQKVKRARIFKKVHFRPISIDYSPVERVQKEPPTQVFLQDPSGEQTREQPASI